MGGADRAHECADMYICYLLGWAQEPETQRIRGLICQKCLPAYLSICSFLFDVIPPRQSFRLPILIAAVWSVAEYGRDILLHFVFAFEPNTYKPFFMAPERAVTEMIHGQQPGISEAAHNLREPPGAFFVGGWTTGMQNGDLEDVIRARCGTAPRDTRQDGLQKGDHAHCRGGFRHDRCR